MVSVIICTYNRNINCILDKLDYFDEIIIVDDNSNIPIISKKYDFNIKIIRNIENKGAAYSRNTGIKNAIGDILLFIDSDVIFNANDIKILLNNIDQYDCVFPTAKFDNGQIIFPKNEFYETRCLNSMFFMIKKNKIKKLFDESYHIYGEDVDFFLNLYKSGANIKHIPEVEIIHPIRSEHTEKEFYYGFKNILKLIINHKDLENNRFLMLCFHSFRFLYAALTKYWWPGNFKETILSTRSKLLKLYFKCIYESIKEKL